MSFAESPAEAHVDLSGLRYYNDTKIVLTELAKYENIQSITFGTAGVKSFVLDAVMEAYPDAALEYTYALCGRGIRSTTESARLPMDKLTKKTFNRFLQDLAYLPNLRELTAYHTTLTFAQLEAVSELYPYLKIHCTVYLGGPRVRTNATAFSTLHGYKSPRFTGDDFRGLKYCENLLALDVGHNAIESLDFLQYTPNLRVLIVADNHIADISPIAQLKDLEYLELFKNPIEDISPLVELPKLFDLNMTFCKISDITPLLQMSGLERLYMTENPLTDEQKQQLREHFPGCDINFDDNAAPTAGGWRQGHPRYLHIRKMFNAGKYKEFKR